MIVNEPEDVTVMSFTLDDVILSAVQKAIEMDDANRPETRVGPSRTLVDRTSDHFSFVEVDSPLPSSSPSGSSTSSSQSGVCSMRILIRDHISFFLFLLLVFSLPGGFYSKKWESVLSACVSEYSY